MIDERRELIGEVNKNSLESVKVHVSEYKGKVYVDARIFVQDSPTDPTAVIATKKGLCLSPDLMLELIPLLSKAQERAALLTGGKG